MRSTTESPQTIDAYIALAKPPVRKLLRQVRRIIRETAPDAVEAIKYGMPTYVLNGNLVHFAACEKHIGFYPTPSAIVRFAKQLTPYVTSKGAVQFPLDAALPLDLIREMVEFRVAENSVKAPRRKLPSQAAPPAKKSTRARTVTSATSPRAK
jgi:uncharacterized protein YdhG (YjbR/CyaY superfamily)